MDLNIKSKKALVTGASRGIGKSIALNLSREGAKVALVARDKNLIDTVVGEMGGEENGHQGFNIDLMDEDSPKKLFSALQRDFGLPDMVVHNLGGTLQISDPLCSIEDWRKVWRFNMEISVELNNLVVQEMKKRQWGRIVHISSVSGLENLGPIPYCSVKAALTAYTRSLGRVLAGDGIVVSAVLPGAVFTEGGHWDNASKERPEHVKNFINEKLPMRRFADPEEISAFVTFLCSPHASQFVGSVCQLDGGLGRSFIS